ncbi:MAG: PaaI family thioesterase [Pseudomonadota bacterium]
MTPADAQAALEKFFAPWVRALDLTFTDVTPGKVTATMPIAPDLMRVGDILSGQALATMADTIMVFACASQEGAFKAFATTNLDTQFLRPGVGELIRCEAQVVKPGKAIYFARATMFAEPSGKAVADATATFYVA